MKQDFSSLAFGRQSCPDFRAMRQLSDDSIPADDCEPLHSRSKTVDETDPAGSVSPGWLEDHMQIVGSPRPARYHDFQADSTVTEDERADAIKQVTFMAERYKAQLEQYKKEVVRRAVSAPTLSSLVNKSDEHDKFGLPPPSPSSSSTSRACPTCCAPAAKLLEIAKSQLARLRQQSRTERNSRLKHSQSSRGLPFDSPDNAVIIFDWDDTLLPTTYLLQTVLPSLPEEHKGASLPETSQFFEELAAHAHIVEFVLRTACRVARVAVVTNSMNPWVVASAARYLPGLDMEALLAELSIPVFYSRRHIESLSKSVTYHDELYEIRIDHSSNARIGMDILPSDRALRIAKVSEAGLVGQWNAEHPGKQVFPGDIIYEVNGHREDLARECRKPKVLHIKIKREVPDRDPYMEAKRIDMDTCMKIFYTENNVRRNVLSVGDSVAEQAAVKEVLPRFGNPAKDSLCKTVALLSRPNVHQLSNELRVLLVWLSKMVGYDKDFDLAMDRLSELEKELFSSSTPAHSRS